MAVIIIIIIDSAASCHFIQTYRKTQRHKQGE